jgi:hypothetical protein
MLDAGKIKKYPFKIQYPETSIQHLIHKDISHGVIKFFATKSTNVIINELKAREGYADTNKEVG